MVFQVNAISNKTISQLDSASFVDAVNFQKRDELRNKLYQAAKDAGYKARPDQDQYSEDWVKAIVSKLGENYTPNCEWHSKTVTLPGDGPATTGRYTYKYVATEEWLDDLINRGVN